MKKFVREFRVIPTLLIAITCLVVLKVAGLLLEGGYILGDQMPRTEKSWAEATLNFPTGRRQAVDPGDITGSVSAKKEEKKEEKPAAAAPEAVRSPDEKVLYPDPSRPITASERAVLESLQARRQEIEARAREIDIRENLIKSAEKRIEGRIEEMKAAESRIGAAKVFDRLEISVLFELASQIAPRKMSDIMGQMQPEAAERLTVEMARRAGADKTLASDLPKIEGRPQPTRTN